MNKEMIIKILKGKNLNFTKEIKGTWAYNIHKDEIESEDPFKDKYPMIGTVDEEEINMAIQTTGVGSGADESLCKVYQLTKDQIGIVALSMFRNTNGQLFVNSIKIYSVMI